MRRNGACTLEFRPGIEFRFVLLCADSDSESFALEEKSFVFQRHDELDEFCVGLEKAVSDVSAVFRDEWNLLKSFDRAFFWLRHLKDPSDDRYFALPPTELTAELISTDHVVLTIRGVCAASHQSIRVICKGTMRRSAERFNSGCPFCDPRLTKSFTGRA